MPTSWWGTLSGAGVGAAVGTAVFPVVGTVAGAAIGALAGIVHDYNQTQINKKALEAHDATSK